MGIHISENTALGSFNTFRIAAFAARYAKITEETALVALYAKGVFANPFFVLGGGSNVLLTGNYQGLVVHMAIKGKQHFIEGNYVYVTASGGEIWNDLVWYCINHHFPGLENMALIPGSVGASPVQNIGAYGVELMDVFYSCRAFDTHTGEFVTFTKEACGFSYRDSIFKSKYKGRYIITSVTYKLHLNSQQNTSYGAIQSELDKRLISSPTIRDIAEVVSHIRVEKLPDPGTIGNAGSFFKNPVIHKSSFNTLVEKFPDLVYYPMPEEEYKLAAGWLIEQCGWKGKQVGNVLIWPKQALVITNAGEATGSEIYAISEKIIEDVASKFGISLEREVNIL
ncbi:UDP-N-acetylmuramate dehydrogenase [Sphingobacterium sp. lm-10]|uniref:UDP-N-acetylmuramate dehydrogenase n=1 Tax=Sphingobacterium sp. lm-10 TaxID=2944904 RepID=UPI0020221C04|nr:UDP-N-acetylmuramate dehydrogenase [Sphingobacterium sp. lm-10]MCL7986384.1 UDP-N-acetylmuramate dehydrogenase [Sphingobacterium sp. lm-10]